MSQVRSTPVWRRALVWGAALAFFSLFVAAGSWQMRRAGLKEQLFANWASVERQPVQSLTAGLADSAPDRLSRVEVEGEYLPGHTILLDNQTRPGRIGVMVYSPLKLADRPQLLLVARGFVAIQRDRSNFPDPPVPSGKVQLRGILAAPPAAGLRLGADASTPANRWPLLTTAIDLPALSTQLQTPLLPLVLLLDPADPSGFERDWQPQTMPPERHKGYAVQWFGLAATVLIVSLYFGFVRR